MAINHADMGRTRRLLADHGWVPKKALPSAPGIDTASDGNLTYNNGPIYVHPNHPSHLIVSNPYGWEHHVSTDHQHYNWWPTDDTLIHSGSHQNAAEFLGKMHREGKFVEPIAKLHFMYQKGTTAMTHTAAERLTHMMFNKFQYNQHNYGMDRG